MEYEFLHILQVIIFKWEKFQRLWNLCGNEMESSGFYIEKNAKFCRRVQLNPQLENYQTEEFEQEP